MKITLIKTYLSLLFLIFLSKESLANEIIIKENNEKIDLIANSIIYTAKADITIQAFKQSNILLPKSFQIDKQKINWLLFSLVNPKDEKTVCYIKSNFLDSLTLYNYDTKEIIGVTGNGFSYDALSRKEETGYIKIELAKGEKLELALKVNGKFPGGDTVIELLNGEKLSLLDIRNTNQNYTLLVVILTFFIFNLLVYITLRDKTYLYYLFYLFSLLFFLGARSFIKGLNLEIETYVVDYVIIDISLILFNISAIKFALSYFEVYSKSIWKKILNNYLYLFILPVVLLIFNYKDYYHEPQNTALALLSLITTLLILIFTVSHLKFNRRVTLLFLVAELPMILGGMFVAFEFLINDTENSLRIGPSFFKISVVLEILLFSFALGNKYREQRLLLMHQLELNEQLKIQKLEDLKLLSEQKNKELAFLIEQRTAELNETNSNLITLNKEKNKIFSILGHDLRSPLASLIMMLELFDSADLTEEDLKKMVILTKAQLINLNSSVENLFTWAQSQMEGLTINQNYHPLRELILEKINLLNIAAIKKNIIISFDNKEDLIAFIDKNHVGIIIQNVLNNAIKFTGENGLIKIEVLQKADMAVIKITDNGVGIKEELIKKINSDQLIKSTKGTAGEKGTGLGLFLCKEMIVKNNGSMTIESVHKEGTSIILKLPLYKNNLS